MNTVMATQSKSREPVEVLLVHGRKNSVLDSLWEDKKNGRYMDAKLIYQDGALLCHRLPFAMASSVLSQEMLVNPAVVRLPYLNLVEAHHFLKIVYGQSFVITGYRLRRMNFILKLYGVDKLKYTSLGVHARDCRELPELPDDINEQIILPPHDPELDDDSLLLKCVNGLDKDALMENSLKTLLRHLEVLKRL